jgi:SAM-dependent methyltransferase
MPAFSEFWDALAPHHAAIENNYFNLPSVRRIVHDVRSPVLVVGAGQGLIVEELRKRGFQCDGVDLSPEMIRYAKVRRGLTLVKADARAMPFGEETYATLIYPTGVVDFIGDEEEIKVILNEGRRIVQRSGNIFVAFYRISAASENFLSRVGLLGNHVLSQREMVEIYRLSPVQALGWVAKKAGVGHFQAAALAFRSWVLSTWQEKRVRFKVQRMFAKREVADSLIKGVPEKLPYRSEEEIRNLFMRLEIPIKQLGVLGSCFVAGL